MKPSLSRVMVVLFIKPKKKYVPSVKANISLAFEMVLVNQVKLPLISLLSIFCQHQALFLLWVFVTEPFFLDLLDSLLTDQSNSSGSCCKSCREPSCTVTGSC